MFRDSIVSSAWDRRPEPRGRDAALGPRVLGGAQETCRHTRGSMAPQTPRKILLIDDEASFVRALARLLHRDGDTVDTAADGQHALAKLHTQRYDVILCDLRLPELDGPALYTRLRQQAPALCQRVIFLTGDTLGTESTAFLAQCGQPWLYKPCTADEVRRTIQQVLDAVAPPGAAATDAVGRTTGEAMEDGTLSIVRRGAGYQVRYASNNPYAPEPLPRACPDETTLRALLHQVGLEAEALQQACAVARTGRVAVLRLHVTPGQRQACFPSPPTQETRGAAGALGTRAPLRVPSAARGGSRRGVER
jgi:CheY-like chemotaxis protein